MAESLRQLWQNAMRSKLLKTGVPIVGFIVAGSFFLQQFASIRYEFRKGKQLSEEDAERLGVKKKVKVADVQMEMLKEFEEKDLDTWENIRGPRPWEDSKTVQMEQRQKSESPEDKR